MIVNVGMVFAVVAPLTLAPLMLWFVLVIPQWCSNFNYVLVEPQGRGFDSGGAFWPTAVLLQTIGLAVSQAILWSILLITNRVTGAVLVALLCVFTMTRGISTHYHYHAKLVAPPLEHCARQDQCVAHAPPNLDQLIADAYWPALKYSVGAHEASASTEQIECYARAGAGRASS
eukprot:CAMPEP_0119356940 /NCGR_PEP_ID=MMETSP1334-20130426/5433_1 /TAXON_ID=127549 /ORGANISM="Calcidiscus leptoporus, Strain RCC1130" /LENGTH=173 /DNA_ID=CAMNT_0007371073 /DNA_START=331 /DNA_END=852 /DNA_ORIENTATION=-